MDNSSLSSFIKPYNLISLNLSSFNILNGLLNMIIETDDIFFYIEDSGEKISDISKMPFYIKLDWINYNKKELDLKTINKHIEYHKKNDTDDLYKMISIRREIIIKMTLK